MFSKAGKRIDLTFHTKKIVRHQNIFWTKFFALENKSTL